MNKITLLLAWRYLLGSTHEKSISTMAFICFLGIAIGSFALALVLCVMSGFEKETHKKLQGIHAQIILNAPFDTQLDYFRLKQVLKQEFPTVNAFAPNAFEQIIIQKPGTDDVTQVVILKGIDPKNEQKVIDLKDKIISKKPVADLSEVVSNNTVILGKKLAEQLELKEGDTFTVLFSQGDPDKRGNLALKKNEMVVGGTISTGIDEFDTGLVLTNLNYFNTLFPEKGITQVIMQLKPDAPEGEIINAMKDRFNLEVVSWKDLYPALVAALKLEKYAMFFILALITLVASMNIISLLFMEITQKKGDIAILKALGLKNSVITNVFVLMGMIITLLGSIVGLIFAYLVGIILKRYPFIELPDSYFVSHLPVHLDWKLFVLVFFVVMFLSLLATWIPARKTQSINISQVLRFEA